MMLWAEYYHERLGGNVILIEDVGFVAYRIQGVECYLEEMYLSPKHRGSGECQRLVSEVSNAGKEAGCTVLTTTVVTGTNGAEHSVCAAVKSGFRIVGAQNGVIYFSKEIQ